MKPAYQPLVFVTAAVAATFTYDFSGLNLDEWLQMAWNGVRREQGQYGQSWACFNLVDDESDVVVIDTLQWL